MLQQTERGLDTQLVFLTSFHEALLNAKKGIILFPREGSIGFLKRLFGIFLSSTGPY